MGQKLYFCDTTQIDVFNARSLTHYHAYPIDNGWVPVDIY